LPKIAFPEPKLVEETELGAQYEVEFPSAYQTRYPENNRVPVRLFEPANGPKPAPAVVITHYWGASDLRPEIALANNLMQRGVASAILTLPYHISRTPAGSHSGEMAIQPDPGKLIAMMTQSELDIRRTLDFLDSRPEIDHSRYGLVGISLGALVSGLAFALDPRVYVSSFVLGGADIAHILWSSSRVIPQREELRKLGWTEAKLRRALAVIEPLSYLPRKAPSRTLVIYGRFDTVVPRADTVQLENALDHPSVIGLDTGHYGGVFIQSKVLRTVADFFGQEMQGKTFVAPPELSGPTLRIGALAGYPTGLDLGVGIDFVHFDRPGNFFGSLFVTPRGLRILLDRKITAGFSAGIEGSTRGVGVGLLWSTVL
jgi:pimeloyl-ACP methyl ester carboxylesterase